MTFSQQQIDELYAARTHELELLKDTVSLKFYYATSEKLQAEKTKFEELLQLHQTKKQQHAQYSFVLDTQFFEQKFLTT